MFYFNKTYLISSEFSNNWSQAKNIIDRNNRLVDIQKQIKKIIVKISKESKKVNWVIHSIVAEFSIVIFAISDIMFLEIIKVVKIWIINSKNK